MNKMLTFATPKTEFKAKNIWAKNVLRNTDQYILFRKKFIVGKAGVVDFTLFANTYYNFYIDGVFINRGPVRRHELNAEFDEIKCYLSEGDHVAAVMVHHFGSESGCHRIGSPAFWMEAETERKETLFVTDTSWKAKFCDAFRNEIKEELDFDYIEDIDMRVFPIDWETVGFDDSLWDNAVITSEIGIAPDAHRNYTPRAMQLFSYVNERSEITLNGVFSEPLEGDFHTRIKNRKYLTGDSGNFVIADFGKVMSAAVAVEYSNASDGCEMVIGYDDRVDETGLPDFTRLREVPYADRIILPKGDGTAYIHMPRGFRFVNVSVLDTGCEIKNVTAQSENYPYTECRPFASGDGYFTRLYEQSLRTQHVCTSDGFVDCVTRERVLWLGDAYLDSLGNLYSEPDKGLLLTTLFEHAMGQKESGALGGYNSSELEPEWLQMGGYNLLWLNMLCDYILYTGDEESVKPLKDTARGILRFISDTRNENGFVDSEMNNCNTFWDWGYEEPTGESLKVSIFYTETILRLSGFDFFSDIIDNEMVEDAKKLKKRCFERFWDNERRVFHDAGKKGEELHPLCTQGANIMAAAYCDCPEEIKNEIFGKVFDKNELYDVPVDLFPPAGTCSYESKILPCGTMYGAFYAAKALFEAGYDNFAAEFMKEVWGEFDGLLTLPELRRNGKENEGTCTMCHGWSAAPAFLLPMYVLGLRPLANGWKETLFSIPDIDIKTVPSAKGIVKTPYGEITAQWVKTDGAVKVTIKAPDEISLTLRCYGREYKLCGGNNTFYIFEN